MKQGASKFPVSDTGPSLDFDHVGTIGEWAEACTMQFHPEVREATVGFRSGRIGVEDGDRTAPEFRKQSLQLND